MDESMYRQHTRSVVHLALLINMLSLGSLMMVMPLGPDFISALSMDAKTSAILAAAQRLPQPSSASSPRLIWIDLTVNTPYLFY